MEHFGEDPLKGHYVAINVKSAPKSADAGSKATAGTGSARPPPTSPAISEKDALLGQVSGNSSGECYNSFYEAPGEDDDMKDQKGSSGITDTMAYRTRSLTTWEAFSITYTTVWVSKELWVMMAKLSVVAVCVAVLTILLVPNPERMQVGKFTEVSKFLNVVVGLLLGFFMSSSMTRWHTCVNGFLELLDAIRNLQMQFVALGVPEKENNLCLRYGFASAWLLYGQLLVETKSLSKEQSNDREVMWHKLNQKLFTIDRTHGSVLLKEWETKVLKMTRDPPGMMWMWVAALIGRLAQDGWIPPMASPTYGRIMNLCQSAHGGIRQVRAAISVQAPLTYTHMLATLVHINNLLNAVTFGLVSGLAIGTAMMNHGVHHWTKKEASNREEQQDMQNMVVTFMYCFFGPLLYQALLLISMHLAQPFDSEDAKIPLDRLLYQLEVDMCNGRDLVDHMDFEKPIFKKPPAPEESKK